MKIKGFQKMTLLDYPGHVACTVFTGGCNFRCPFCHNASLVLGEGGEDFTEDEIIDFLEKRKGILDGVAITGGEPLLQSDISSFMRKIRALGYKIKLDTNGSFPEKLREIVNEGLCDYVAIDIKNSPEKYSVSVGRLGYDVDRISESINILMTGGVEYEFRTTVVAELHSIEDIARIGAWIKGAKRWYLQGFVDSGDLISAEMHGLDREILDLYIEKAREYISDAELRGV